LPVLTLVAGFPEIQYRRDLPKRGLSGYGTFAVGAAVIAGGFVLMGQGNRHIRAVRQETRRRRLNISAVLQAEQDRRLMTTLLATYEREAEIMKGRDWVVGESTYHTRWMEPYSVVKLNY
jgi:NADH dehydrogenase (ubiquinone) 1 alpha subcomplex subunit 13